MATYASAGAEVMVLLLLALTLTRAPEVLGQETVALDAEPGSSDTAAASTIGSSDPLADASPSIISTGVHSRLQLPRQQKVVERHPMVTEKPSLKAMTVPQLHAAFSTAVPAVVPSSDALDAEPAEGPITPKANGVAGAAYDDSRFGTGTDFASVAKQRVGRLRVRYGGSWYSCSASVINKALLVTAAHCVFQWGKKTTGWPDRDANGNLQVTFEPGLDGTSKPYGTWTAQAVMVPPTYFDGTDTSDVGATGVVVNNDVALIWLKPLSGRQIGDVVGWFGYGVNGWSFSAPAADWGLPAAPATGMLTQFGYPAAFDGGVRMQISNAATYTMSSDTAGLKNMVRGTAMTGGSSGGPWIANYGVDAVLSGTNYGSNTVRNVILGVTSWGYTDGTAKLQGASFFGTTKELPGTYGTRGAGNIGKLMFDACDNTVAGSWQLKSKSLCV